MKYRRKGVRRTYFAVTRVAFALCSRDCVSVRALYSIDDADVSRCDIDGMGPDADADGVGPDADADRMGPNADADGGGSAGGSIAGGGTAIVAGSVAFSIASIDVV